MQALTIDKTSPLQQAQAALAEKAAARQQIEAQAAPILEEYGTLRQQWESIRQSQGADNKAAIALQVRMRAMHDQQAQARRAVEIAERQERAALLAVESARFDIARLKETITIRTRRLAEETEPWVREGEAELLLRQTIRDGRVQEIQLLKRELAALTGEVDQ